MALRLAAAQGLDGVDVRVKTHVDVGLHVTAIFGVPVELDHLLSERGRLERPTIPGSQPGGVVKQHVGEIDLLEGSLGHVGKR
jgi:hypothetical protein